MAADFDADSLSLEFSRRFRALPAWCALYSLGREGFRHIVEQCLANAALLISLIEANDGIELINAEGQRTRPFCIVGFRIVHSSWNGQQANAANHEAVTLISASGTRYVSGTVWDGQNAIRAAFVNWQTRDQDVRQLFEEILAARQQIIQRNSR